MPKITFLKTGDTFDAPDGASYLEVCQANDLPHDFGCTVGSCGTCCCVLEEGAEHVNPVGDEERDTLDMVTEVKGARLGCQLVVNGDISVRPIEDPDG